MKNVYALASNITTSIGGTTEEVWHAVMEGKSGISRHEAGVLSPTSFWASRIPENAWEAIENSTIKYKDLSRFERMCVASITDALSHLKKTSNLSRTVIILATTKGNITGLSRGNDERNLLTKSAAMVADALNIITKPVVVSHACVSGVTALLMGMRLLQSGVYDNAIVVGADRFSRFVLSGFQSFQAIADGPCRPFDEDRNGINLGEAAATIILSIHYNNDTLARLCGGATSNDANHISGPSRTGEELALAISNALAQSGLAAADINAISAHGTATIYNDEMEAKAFGLAGLLEAEVHSMKGYVGHTLGAAGILESAMVLESLHRQQKIPSIGYKKSGVSQPLKVGTTSGDSDLNYILKTASGFGGCNAVAIWGKVENTTSPKP